MDQEKQTGENKTALSDDNVYAILAYIWVLCLIPILMKKRGEFIEFHMRQGLILFIAEIAFFVIGIIPFLGTLIYMVGMFLCGVLSLIAIANVLMGKQWKIPIMGEWAERVKL
ncbi:MAG: hypothetical protein ABH883_08370 [Candidatus Omnitrophota bacterium]